MAFRPKEGPVPSSTAPSPPVKTIYYDWEVGADFVGVVFEVAKAIAMLLVVSLKSFHSRTAKFCLV
jgi:hypothetical protein